MTWYSGTKILGNSETVIAESSLARLESNRSLNEIALDYIAQALAFLIAVVENEKQT